MMTRFVFAQGHVHIIHDACPQMAVWDHPWPITDRVGRAELIAAAKDHGIPTRHVYRLLRSKGLSDD